MSRRVRSGCEARGTLRPERAGSLRPSPRTTCAYARRAASLVQTDRRQSGSFKRKQELTSRQHTSNEIDLSIRVRLAVLGKLLLQYLLYLPVTLANPVIGSEDVPEPQVVAPLGIVDGHHVEIMRSHLGRAFLHEEVATLRTGIAPIDIAGVLELRPAGWNHRGCGNRNSYVDDRLCVQSRYRGAPHALDIQYVAPNVLLKDASFLLEHVLTTHMVRDDSYSSLLEADHASSLDPECRVTAHPSCGPRDPGLTEVETLCN